MVTPLQFKEERVLDKVKLVPYEEFEALFPKFQPSRVTITTNDGKSYATRVDFPKGDPRDPMTEEEIAVEFHRARWRRHRQGSVPEVATLHHEPGDRGQLGGLFELTTAR